MNVQPVTLFGCYVRLEPLDESHAPGLFAAGGWDEDIWRYLPYGQISALEQMTAWVQDMLGRQARGTDLPFCVLDQAGGQPIGATRLMEIQPEHRGLEVGGTWYGAAARGTLVNTECKLLLLRHAFEGLGCIRVQIKTDGRNLRSQAAIERLGAVKEGMLRKHRILPGGYQRDSVIYSIVDDEWPAVKARLEARLAP